VKERGDANEQENRRSHQPACCKLVLLSAMLEPRVSLGLALAFLVILAGYKLIQSTRRPA